MDVEDLIKKARLLYKPPPRIRVSEWASEYYELPETSAEPGKWSPYRAPYQPDIMDAINEPGINRVSLMCSAQVGKTIILLAIICYFIDLDPCSMLMTQPTTEMAEIFSKEKLSSAIINVKPVARKISQKSRNSFSTILMKMFAGGFLRLSGANSPSSLASMSIRVYLGDEVDKYPVSAGKEGDPVQLAIERTSTFWNRLVFLVSTPSIKGNSRIESDYENSDKRLCFVPCPHCGEYQHLAWDNFEYAGKGTDDAEPLSGVYFVCNSCDGLIEEKHKSQMISLLEWRATASPKNPGHAGFQLSRFYSPWVRWQDIALNYEAARGDLQQLQVFWNATLGLPFEKAIGDSLDWERLRDRSKLSGYAQGGVPMGGLVLTAGVDVQADRLEVAVWAWGKGEQAWLIRYEKILGDPLQPETWEQLASLTLAAIPHESGAELRIRAVCIDSGYLTQEVYIRVRKFKYLHWFAIKGVSGDRPLVASPTFQEINYRGEKIKKGIQLYKVGVDTAKESLYARSQIDQRGDKYLNFPNDLHSKWFEEFCSEIQVTQHKNGRPYIIWEKLAGVRNEALDTSIYALAAASLVGITRLDWESEERKLIATDSKTQTKNKTRARTKIRHRE
jgi:phage terminase large subunit GpA-like protein